MTPLYRLSTNQAPASLGVLSVHLDGNRCKVDCDFCYLGTREGEKAPPPDLSVLRQLLNDLDYQELAVAINDPAESAWPAFAVLCEVAQARGCALAVTTTLTVAAAYPEKLAAAARLNLSVDGYKGASLARIREATAAVQVAGKPEVVLIASLDTPAFAARLIAQGMLAQLLELATVDRVALNALKPPPRWCNREFWLQALKQLQPLLQVHLDKRLFLDCYVAARLLNLGGCPGRADLTPSADGFAFRSCVYQAAADFTVTDAATLKRRLQGWQPPTQCPFVIT